MNVWLHGWKRKGWVTASGKPVKNLPLIQYADLLLEERRIVLRQKVHSTRPWALPQLTMASTG